MEKNQHLSRDARSNFGFKGWWIIIFSALNWYFYGGLVNVSMNTVVPQLAGKLGVESGNLLSLNTPAGLVSLVVCLFIGRAVEKIGVRKTNGVLLLLGAVCVFAWGSASSLTGYTIALFAMVICMNAVQLVGGNMTVTNWFPRKKGIAIGWATMGLNIASATFVSILVALSAALGGIRFALYVMAGCLVLLAIVNFLFYRDYPEQWNAFPDNDPTSQRREKTALRTGWTRKKVLCQKETWFIGLSCGFWGAVTVGFVSTLVPSLIMKGFTQPEALRMMTISGALGLLGSYGCGWLDQKFGAKTSSIIYSIWCIVGIAFFLLPGKTCAWIYVVMIGMSLGGSNNFPPSMTAQIFGRDGSIVAFPIVFFIKGLFVVIPGLVLGQSLVRTGSYNAGWIVFEVLTVAAMVLIALTKLDPKRDPIEDETK